MSTLILSDKGIGDIFRMPCITGIHKNSKNGKTMFMVRTTKGLALANVGDKLIIEGNEVIEIEKVSG